VGAVGGARLVAVDDEGDWSELIERFGLDPADVEVTVVKKRWRHGSRVRALHVPRGWSCEADHQGTTRENAEAAIAGLLELLCGGAS
jgi:hypothetical protein